MTKYRIFYNEDCDKYGIQEEITDYMGTRWHQIIIPGKENVYTKYKKVAERWLKQLEK